LTNGNVAIGAISNDLAFRSGGATRMRLDSAGNLGLGVTPSVFNSGVQAIQVGAGVLQSTTGNNTVFGSNTYFATAGGNKYAVSDYATAYGQNAGGHYWSIAPPGTAGNSITFPQAMTLSSAGNLGIGATSMGTTRLVIRGDATTNFAVAKWSHSSNASSGFDIGYASSVTSNDVSLWNYENGFIRFATNGSERARIDSSGNLLVGTTATTGSATNSKQLVGGVFSTVSGSVSAATSTATTIFTSPTDNVAAWFVTVNVSTASTAYAATYVINAQGGSATVATQIYKGANISVTMSGYNVQVTQTSGVTQTVSYSAIRIA